MWRRKLEAMQEERDRIMKLAEMSKQERIEAKKKEIWDRLSNLWEVKQKERFELESKMRSWKEENKGKTSEDYLYKQMENEYVEKIELTELEKKK